MRACRKYWLMAVSSMASLVQILDDFLVAFHEILLAENDRGMSLCDPAVQVGFNTFILGYCIQ